MANRRTATSESSGIFSSVFSFVSRELESFVTNATGGAQVEYDDEEELEPSPPRLRKPKEHRGGPIRTKRTSRNARTEEHGASRHRSPTRSRNHVMPEPKQRAKRSQMDAEELSASDDSGAGMSMRHHSPPRVRSPSIPNSRQRVEEYTSFDDPSVHPTEIPPRQSNRQNLSPSRANPNSRRTRPTTPVPEDPPEIVSHYSPSPSPSPSPPPLPRALRRRPSISMPGSLFPRSPSLVPDPVRHVRFEPGITSPLPTLFSPAPEPSKQPGPSRRGSVVKTAVERFHVGEADADPSILLPSPNNSPARPGKAKRPEEDPPRISTRDKGKGRAVDEVLELDAWDGDTSGEVRVRGKERELVAAREEQKRHERRREKEKHLNEEADREKAVDKERIRMLEDEIMRLKEELSKRPAQHTSVHTSIPPPPPPPPLPPPPPIAGGSTRLPTTDFTSARAALKHAPPPVEAPINPPVPSKRQGQPAIGIPPDKMAAFLTEMKTVRLKKVSADPSSGSSSSNIVRSNSLNQGSMSLVTSLRKVGDSSFSVRRNSFERNDVPSSTRVGDKRKRDNNELSEYQEDLRTGVKRRSLASSDSSFASTSSSSFLFSQSYPPPARLAISAPSRATASGTDATTPSLCSDNGADVDDRLPSTPPIPPSRNIYRFKGTGIPVNSPNPHAYEKQLDIIDVDMLGDDTSASMRHTDTTADVAARYSMMPPPLPKSPHVSVQNAADLFAKRPPISPMPSYSPRKPRPPARTRPLPPTPPRRRTQGSDEEDPMLLTFSPEQPKSRIPRRKAVSRTSPERESSASAHREVSKAGATKSERGSNAKQEQKARRGSMRSGGSADGRRGESMASSVGSSSQVSSASRGAGRSSRRRLTLDEEMRDAREADNNEDGDDEDEESGVLVGVGTRSKRLGFLAHGGAGGAPVFMGVGYVDGAEKEQEENDEEKNIESFDEDEEEREEDEEDDEYLPEPSRRGTSSATPVRRRSRR